MTTSEKIKFSKNQIRGLANNLVMLLKKHNLSENDLALVIRIPTMTIRRLASGETTDPHISTLQKIAEHFDVSIDSLIADSNVSNGAMMHKNNLPIFVPVLDWATVAGMNSPADIDLRSWKTWQPVVPGLQHKLSDQVFIIESKPSMAPRFPLGTLFVIDPHAAPMDGDLVLLKIKEDASLSIREIMIDPPKWQLKPTIAGSETIFYSPEGHTLVGPILLTLLYSRR